LSAVGATEFQILAFCRTYGARLVGQEIDSLLPYCRSYRANKKIGFFKNPNNKAYQCHIIDKVNFARLLKLVGKIKKIYPL